VKNTNNGGGNPQKVLVYEKPGSRYIVMLAERNISWMIENNAEFQSESYKFYRHESAALTIFQTAN
jgi:hypothetical protein